MEAIDMLHGYWPSRNERHTSTTSPRFNVNKLFDFYIIRNTNIGPRNSTFHFFGYKLHIFLVFFDKLTLTDVYFCFQI